MAKHGKGLRAFLFANPAGILLKRDIEHPMQRVLDAPVLPYRMGEPPCVGWERRQKIAGVDLDCIPYFPTGFHHPDALQIGPGRLGSTPFNVRCDPIPTRFNAAVIPINSFVVGVLDISKAGVPGISEKQRHCLRERRVIVLEGQDVICFLLCNPRSRSLTELIDFMRRGHFVPRVVKLKGVTDQQVMGLQAVYLPNLMITYPELDHGDLGK